MTEETFVVRARVTVPAWLRIDARAWPLPPTRVRAESEITLGIEYAGPKETVLDVTWTTRMPFDENAVRTFMDRKILGVPDSSHPLGMQIVDLCPRLVGELIPIVARLCAHSETSEFSEVLRMTDYRDLLQSAEVTVRDLTFEVRPHSYKIAERKRPAKFLNADELQRALSRQTRTSDYFLVQADACDRRFDAHGMVAALATALETDGYGCLGKLWLSQRKQAPPFAPAAYLGTGYPGARRNFGAEFPTEYAQVHELWGARHEVVHHGELSVRAYDVANDRAYKTKLRPLTDADLVAFRVAARAAITWMATNRRSRVGTDSRGQQHPTSTAGVGGAPPAVRGYEGAVPPSRRGS